MWVVLLGVAVGAGIIAVMQGHAMTRSDWWSLVACAVLTGLMFGWLLWAGTGR